MKRAIQKFNRISKDVQWDEKLTIDEIKEKAKNKDFLAELMLAFIYYEEENYLLAYDIISDEKFKDNVQAQLLLFLMYYYGYAVEKSIDISYKICSREEFSDSPTMKYNLACFYSEKDNGVTEHNYKKAFEMFKESAENNHSPSYYAIGWCYYEGTGVEKNYEKALHWFLKYIESDDYNYAYEKINTNYMIALMYYYGDKYLEKNKEKAYEWAAKNEKDNDIDSNYLLALICYENGNYKEAKKILDNEQFKDDEDANSLLSFIYRNRYFELEGSAETIIKELEDLSEKGFYFSISLLSRIKEENEIQEDFQSVIKNIENKKLKDQKNITSDIIYHTTNEEKRLFFRKFFADIGDEESQLLIAKLFLSGKEVGVNKEKIYKYLEDILNKPEEYFIKPIVYYYMGLILEKFITDENKIETLEKSNDYFKKSIQLFSEEDKELILI